MGERKLASAIAARHGSKKKQAAGHAWGGLALLICGAGSFAEGCKTRGINSDVLLGAFNGGAIDSTTDPALSAQAIAVERVVHVVKPSLVRGFDTQGVRSGPSVASWLEDRHVQLLAWQHVQRRLGTCPPEPPRPVGASMVKTPTAAPTPSPLTPPTSSGSVPSLSAAVVASSGTAAPAEPVSAPASRPSRTITAPIGQTSPVSQSAASLASDDCAADFFHDLYGYLLDSAPPAVRIANGPVCGAKGVTEAASYYADAGRLAAALDIAAIDLARMLDQEKVLNGKQAEAGLKAAMLEAAAYMRDRRWKPSPRTPTFGLAIKGGASTGVYSAGVVWRVLTLLQRYQSWKAEELSRHPDSIKNQNGVSPADARFSVASGTSAGAIIAAVTDIFHQDSCSIDCDIDPNPNACKRPECAQAATCQSNVDRSKLKGVSHHRVVERGATCQEYARRLTSSLFTCPTQSQLYCVDSRPLWNLAGSQQGLMDFDGLRNDYLSQYILKDVLVNSTELVLTTVDFRWGQLYVQSDQDPATVESSFPAPTDLGLRELNRNIQASFVLPFIAWPVRTLRVHGAERTGTFVDGGIQSEIPINALTQRGVERAIVVGSAPPQSTPTSALTSGLSIAARYIDVSLSGVTATEWRDAVPHARYVEAFEYAACKELFAYSHPSGLPDDVASVEAFCTGRLTESCGGTSYDPLAPKQGSHSDPLAGLRDADRKSIANHEPGRRFDLIGIFRNESVAPTFGYSFDPIQMRRLFATGVSDGRQRCVELAFFLGMGDAVDQLDTWCNESPKFDSLLCEAPSQDYKTCSAPPDSVALKP